MAAPDLAALVKSLKDSPLFNLSLASKELFHSNFLAWFCEVYPSVAGPLFATFTKTPGASCDSLRVYREQRNIDLTIDFANGQRLTPFPEMPSYSEKDR